MIGLGLFDTSLNTAVFETVAEFRSVNVAFTNAAYIKDRAVAGDGGGGLFVLVDEVAAPKVEVDGLYYIADDGAGWARQWDGKNAQAAWFGARPSPTDLSGPDNGPVIAKLPKYAITHWGPGRFLFATIPTYQDWQNTTHRGVSTVFQVTCAMAVDQVFHYWSFTMSEAFGAIAGQNIGDLVQTGYSPIEGIALVGSDIANGIGTARYCTTGLSQYFTKPRNYSVENFRVGFGNVVPVRNLFCTGYENCVVKGCYIGFDIDNTGANPADPGAYNSGENVTLINCVTSNITGIALRVRKMQKLTWVGGSLDYSAVMVDADNSLVKITGAYIESKATTSPGAWFKAAGVSALEIDSTTIIYCLPPPEVDLFQCSDIATIECNASFFGNQSSPTRMVLYTGSVKNVRGHLRGANGKNYPPLLSQQMNLIADGDFASGGLTNMLGGAGNTFRATVVSDVVRPGQAYACKLSSPTSDDGARLAFRQIRVEPGRWLFFNYWDKLTGTIVNLANRIQWLDAAGNQLGSDQFVGGLAYPANFATASFSPNFTTTARDWTLQRAVAQVPQGAFAALIQVRIDPSSSGDYYISEAQAYL